MRTTRTTTLILGALLTAAAASAADSPTTTDAPTRAEKRAAMRQQFFDKIDANHDGTISRDEYLAWVDGRFAKLDSNGDGVVDADEAATSEAAAERAEKRAKAFVRRYDTSGSGQVSKADFEAKAMQHFDRLSQGSDAITEAEFAAARPRGRHRGPAPADGG